MHNHSANIQSQGSHSFREYTGGQDVEYDQYSVHDIVLLATVLQF